MSVPSPAFVGTKGRRWAAACRRQISVCSLYSSISTSTRLDGGPEARREPEALERDEPRDDATRTQPPATSHSIGIPATTATTVRSLTRRRASVRTNAIGAAFIDRPPIADRRAVRNQLCGLLERPQLRLVAGGSH